jgi:outer membrane murein-binding lipoprotein Lpp
VSIRALIRCWWTLAFALTMQVASFYFVGVAHWLFIVVWAVCDGAMLVCCVSTHRLLLKIAQADAAIANLDAAIANLEQYRRRAARAQWN